MLKGIAASQGIAVARVYKLEQPVLHIEKQEHADVEKELARLDAAFTKTVKDIEGIKAAASKNLKEEELAIFDAHLMMIQDPDFRSQIEDEIRNGEENADFAAKNVSDMMVSMFESMDDAYMKERAADIKDVSFRLLCNLEGKEIPNLATLSEPVVIVAKELTPSDTGSLNKEFAKGFATEIGGRTSHSAIMARSLEIPAVVGITGIMDQAENGQQIILDAIDGTVILNPSEAETKEYEAKAAAFEKEKEELKTYVNKETVSTDGHKVLAVGNIGSPADVQGVIDNGGEGVGLFRTEFLYMKSQDDFPSEDVQFEEEMNPFLGVRAIRFCLMRKDIFRVQLRALLRASAFGKLCIMFPMIATLNEFREAKAVYNEEREKLVAEGVKIGDDVEVGCMIEIPAAAVLADKIAEEADFFSIGTNDLIQYTMAADRMSQQVSYLYQPLNPSILRLIKHTIDGAHQHGRWCGMCGEMAGDEMAAPVLLGLGLDEFSMSASSITRARRMIDGLSYAEMQKLADQALNCSTEEEVTELVRKALGK